MASYVLDTNIVSLILRGDTQVRENFEKIVNPDNIILGCPVVWYELRRGLVAKDARRQVRRFEALFATFQWQNLTFRDWSLAATLWA
jgi:predicted nucleic acid-binding protein